MTLLPSSMMAWQPQVYIFDDSFSALDARTDAALRQRLTQEVAGKTVLIVGQRINTIAQADTIIVLDEGRIVGQGRHQELMETCAVYQEIAASQLSEHELAALERPAPFGVAAQGGVR